MHIALICSSCFEFIVGWLNLHLKLSTDLLKELAFSVPPGWGVGGGGWGAGEKPGEYDCFDIFVIIFL